MLFWIFKKKKMKNFNKSWFPYTVCRKCYQALRYWIKEERNSIDLPIIWRESTNQIVATIVPIVLRITIVVIKKVSPIPFYHAWCVSHGPDILIPSSSVNFSFSLFLYLNNLNNDDNAIFINRVDWWQSKAFRSICFEWSHKRFRSI